MVSVMDRNMKHSCLHRLSSARGFTLVEAVVVLAVLAVLVTVGSAGMRQLLLTQRVKTASFDLYSSLTYARSEAITRNTSVTIAPNGGNWANGWTIGTDVETLRRQDAMTNITVTGPASMQYNGMGRLAPGGDSRQFDITASGVSGSNVRCISVDLSGRPIVKPEACS
jgi:type IV fimbrial biogenesis protein FimT